MRSDEDEEIPPALLLERTTPTVIAFARRPGCASIHHYCRHSYMSATDKYCRLCYRFQAMDPETVRSTSARVGIDSMLPGI